MYDNFKEIMSFFGMAIPLVSFAVLAVGLFFFVRDKGRTEALKEAAATYKTLSEAKQQEVDALEERIEKMDEKIRQLEKLIDTQREAISIAVDELTKSFIQNGVCSKAATCRLFEENK